MIEFAEYFQGFAHLIDSEPAGADNTAPALTLSVLPKQEHVMADEQITPTTSERQAQTVHVRRSYRFRIYPTKTQAILLGEQLETLRRIYNACLAERKEAWDREKRSVKGNDQRKAISVIRNAQKQSVKNGEKSPQWYARVSSIAIRDTIVRLDRAYENFYRRVASGAEKPGYPKFKKAKEFRSIPFFNYGPCYGAILRSADRSYILGSMEDSDLKPGSYFQLYGVGRIRVKIHRPVKGRIKTLQVYRNNGKWYVVLSSDLGKQEVEPSSKSPVGIDVGLAYFLTTSEGEHVDNPRYLKNALKELRRAQRAMGTQKKQDRPRQRAKKKFGANWYKAVRKVSKIHEKICNRRSDHHHKVALDLVRRYGAVAVEDLNVQGMVKNHWLSRAIRDTGWAGFLTILTYKAQTAGVGVVRVDPAYTSRTCSVCGHCEKGNRPTQERFCCLQCGHAENADVNAAKNILAKAGIQVRVEPAGLNVAHRGERVPRRDNSSETAAQVTLTHTEAISRPPARRRSDEPTLWEWLAQQSTDE